MRELNPMMVRIPTGQVPDTAEECFTLAAAALVQAEKAIDESFSGDVVHAVVAIADAWTALGRGLQYQPQELSFLPMMGSFVGESDPEPTPVFESTSGDLAEPEPHVHTVDCGHSWMGIDICGRCTQAPVELTPRCPQKCPEPGQPGVHG